MKVLSVEDLEPIGEAFGPLTAENDRAANEALLLLRFQKGLLLASLQTLRQLDATICLMTDGFLYAAFVRYRSGLTTGTRGDRCVCGCGKWRFTSLDSYRSEEFDFFAQCRDTFEAWLETQDKQGANPLEGYVRIQVFRFNGKDEEL